MPQSLATGNLRAPFADRGLDLYETPAAAVEALLRAEKLPPYIWECACGSGNIVKVLRKHGHQVLATDLVDYGCPDSKDREDFLFSTRPLSWVDAIVTNRRSRWPRSSWPTRSSLGSPRS
jgi:hypothetical protein